MRTKPAFQHLAVPVAVHGGKLTLLFSHPRTMVQYVLADTMQDAIEQTLATHPNTIVALWERPSDDLHPAWAITALVNNFPPDMLVTTDPATGFVLTLHEEHLSDLGLA